jgi:nitronate monooxygenase
VVKAETARPWGVGLITWATTYETVQLALDHKPRVLMLSFGDPRPYATAIKAAGCALICQIQNVEGAHTAKEAGADFIVAQGTEAGGHGAARATLPLVPAVVNAVAPTPVLAAGGIADGRTLTAALMLGAQGVLMGTRFYAASRANYILLIRDSARKVTSRVRGRVSSIHEPPRRIVFSETRAGRSTRSNGLPTNR